MSAIKELGDVDFSDRELKGLAIENAKSNESRILPNVPLSDAEFVAVRLHDMIRNYEAVHVTTVEEAAIVAAIRADPSKKAAVAIAADVDLVAEVDKPLGPKDQTDG